MNTVNTKNDLKTLFDSCNKAFFSSNITTVPIQLNPSKFICYWNGSYFNVTNFSCKQEFLISFLHEMIHIENYQKKIKDVGTNSYHKKSFLEKAINLGFFVIKHKTKGWSLLSLHHPRNTVFEHFCVCPQKNNNEKIIDFFSKIDIPKFGTNMVHKKKSTFKYACSCPAHNSIRSGRDPNGNNPLDAKCLICNSRFEFVG